MANTRKTKVKQLNAPVSDGYTQAFTTVKCQNVG